MRELDVLDVNCFIGNAARPEPMTFTTRAELLAEMDYYHISEAIVTHAAARDYHYATGNEVLMDQLRGESKLHGCWVLPVHPTPDDEPIDALVGKMLEEDVKIARVYPPNRIPLVVTPWLGYEVFEELAARHIPLLLTDSDLANWPDQGKIGFTTEKVYELCQAFPNLPVIIVRFNYQLITAIFSLFHKCPNLHIEISNFTVHRGVELVVNEFGSERIVYGSGMPLQNAGASLAILRYAAISDEDRLAIAGGNARRLLEGVKSHVRAV